MIWVLVAILATSLAGLGWALAGRRRASAAVERHRAALDRANERLEHLERAFQRFAPLEIVEQVSRGTLEFRPDHRKVTVMFADLKGFTPLSERIEPEAMVEMLNGYFTAMDRAITAHHGHLARLMGDGLMALFGALGHNRWQAADAVQAALAMREALAGYNVELVARGMSPLKFGVGIHCGEVVAGVMGSERFTEFTVIGDHVNIAARVEALTRVLPADILITDAVRRELADRFELREMPPTAVKGKSEPLTTWAVIGRGP